MKKILLTLTLAVASLAASAQVYVGGEVGFWRNYQDNQTTFRLAPEVGYNLSDKWALGIGLGYTHAYSDGVKLNAFGVNPYARWTYASFGPVNLFLDGGFDFGTYKVKDGGDAYNTWSIGVKPGLSVNLTEKLSFVAHAGFLGYRDADDGLTLNYSRGFGFDLDGNSLQFGLYYNF